MIERLDPQDKITWDLHYIEHKQRYEFFKEFYSNKDVLDAASGVGFGTEIIANNAKEVLGIDISVDAIEFATKEYKRFNTEFMVLDCNKIDELGKTFDVVTSFETIEHLDDPEIFIKRVKTVLRKDGYFFCSIPNIYRHSLAGLNNEHHLSEMPLEDMLLILNRHFLVESIYYQNESAEYKRFINTISHYDNVINGNFSKINTSLAFRFENKLRKLLNKSPIEIKQINSYPIIGASAVNDFVIEKCVEPYNWQKTFIIILRHKI